jgi:NifU-like protein involved in Fe-S cluster formation
MARQVRITFNGLDAKIEAKGVKGGGCVSLLAPYEALGKVVDRKAKPELFEIADEEAAYFDQQQETEGQ